MITELLIRLCVEIRIFQAAEERYIRYRRSFYKLLSISSRY